MVGSIRTFTTIPHSDVGDRTVSLLEIYSIDISTAVFLHVYWKLKFSPFEKESGNVLDQHLSFC